MKTALPPSGAGYFLRISFALVSLFSVSAGHGQTTNAVTNGGTIASGVTAIITNPVTSITGPITNNGTLQFWQSTTLSNRFVISGTGSLAQNGAGTTILNATNTYTGATTVNAGTLMLSNAVIRSASQVINGSNSVLEYFVGTDINLANSTKFTGNGVLRKTGTGQLFWDAAAAEFAMSGGRIEVNEGTFVGGGSGNEVWTSNKASLFVAAGARFVGGEGSIIVDALEGSGTITSGFSGPYNPYIRFGVNNGSGTFAGTISNMVIPAKLFKAGTGTQTLSGTNTHTGATVVEAGVLNIAATGRILSSAVSVTNGATLQVDGQAGSVSVLAGGLVQGSGSITNLAVSSNGLVQILTASTNTAGAWNTGGTISFSAGSKIDVTGLSLGQPSYVLLRGTNVSGTPVLQGATGYNVANSSNSITLTFDGNVPAVTSFTSTTATLTNTTTATFSLLFNENVTGLQTTDFVVSGDTTGWTVSSVTGTNAGPYTVTVTRSITNWGTMVLTLNSNSVADAVLNAGPAASTNASIFIVPTAPTNTVAPTMSGTFANQSTVTGANGTWTPTNPPLAFTYQWQVSGTNTQAGPWTNIPSATATNYLIPTNYIGQYLRYAVTATNAGGRWTTNSVASAKVAAIVPTAPGTPSGAFGNTSVALRWTAPTNDGGASLTNYGIQFSANNGTNWFAATTTPTPVVATNTNTMVTGLTNGVSYVFRVGASNSVGITWSSNSTAVVPCTVPGAPTNLVATAVSSGTIRLTFGAPATNGGSAITSYIATASPGGLTATSAVSPLNFSGLNNGTSYTFSLVASNVAGSGAAATTSNGITAMDGAPSEVGAYGLQGSIEVGWSTSGILSATNYRIYAGPNAGSLSLLTTVTNQIQRYVDTYLPIGTTKYYKVVPLNGTNELTGSSVVSATSQYTATATYAYTGAVQTNIVPNGVNWMKVSLAGGQGSATPAYSTIGPAGKGGLMSGFLNTAPSNSYSIFVGGAALWYTTNVGYNGGGVSGSTVSGAGGGATDVRQGGTNLVHRVLVAGGGGGGGYNGNRETGGAGGGLIGGNGLFQSSSTIDLADLYYGAGGGFTLPGKVLARLGSNGVGGTGTGNGGGGGGGYVPGGGGNSSGGGGGSSYGDTNIFKFAVHTQGTNSGAGWANFLYPFSGEIKNLKATGWQGYNDLSWDPSLMSSLKGYRVYGGPSPNPTTVITNLLAPINYFRHSNLTIATTYYYRVTAVALSGTNEVEGPLSGQISAIPTYTAAKDISFANGMETFVVPAGVTTLKVEAWGGSGAATPAYETIGPEGKGGKTEANLAVTPGETLNLFVGGAGTGATTKVGYNGGGVSGGAVSGAGGGATDVRQGGTNLIHRVLVAGGGGGGGYNGNKETGGAGGGLIGGNGLFVNSTTIDLFDLYYGAGGGFTFPEKTLLRLGVNGVGGTGTGNGGGGGGGYLPGGGGANSGGGGGSSYADPTKTAYNIFQQGTNSGNGKFKLTWAVTAVPTDIVVNSFQGFNDISWPASQLAGLTGYKIYWGTSPNPSTLLTTLGPTVSAYRHTGLSNGVKYYYKISTTDSYTGESPKSADVSGTPALTQSKDISFANGMESFVVPAGVTTLKVEAWGGSGSAAPYDRNIGPEGKGGKTEANLAVTPGETLNLFVGGAGTGFTTNVGYNGGGVSGNVNSGAGGGATDVRQGGTNLIHRVLVAGGGGGGGYNGNKETGGAGGGLIGGNGLFVNSTTISLAQLYYGAGGGFTFPEKVLERLGTNGVGGTGFGNGGGGGGGYLPGGGGHSSGGGGGSSYADLTKTAYNIFQQGTNSGNGKLKLTWVGSPTLNLSANASANRVNLYWDASAATGLLSYRLYGGTSPTPSVVLTNLSNGITTFANTNLSNGTTYYYSYSLVTTDGESSKSAVVSATPLAVNSTNFNYTNVPQNFTVPAKVGWLTIEANGAQGSAAPYSPSQGLGGKGGKSIATIPVTAGEQLKIYVGGAGTGGSISNVGYNGGGVSGNGNGGTGGGATDVRQGGTNVTNRVLVAGGGGGGGYNGNNEAGGAGGGLIGGNGLFQNSTTIDLAGLYYGAGGGFTFPGKVLERLGTNGVGGAAINNGGGGGGGYVPGGGGNQSGGGGGSSYATPNASYALHTQGVNTGNGSVLISWAADTNSPVVTAISSPMPNGLYKLGDVIPLAITFSEPVVFSGGSPILKLKLDSGEKLLTYLSGNYSSAYNFRYTVESGDLAAKVDSAGTTALLPNGATMQDSAQNVLVTTTPDIGANGSLGKLQSIAVDGVLPIIPNGLAGSGGNQSVVLNWNANPESDIAGYRVYWGISSPPTDLFVTTKADGLTALQTGLVNGLTYYYQVAAIDLAGNEGPRSSIISVVPFGPSIASGKVTQSLIFNPPGSKTYGDAPLSLSATASSGLTPTYTVLSGPATVSGSTLTLTGPGSVLVRVTQDGDTSYMAAASVDRTIVVLAPVQTITFGALGNKVYGDAPFALNATASSSLAVSYSVVSGPATLSGDTVTLTGVGTVTIRASQTGNSSWLAATPVDQSFTVSRKSLTVTAQNTNRAYGAVNPAFTASFTGFVNGESSSVISGTAGFATTATSSSAPGTYPITPSLGSLSAANYSFTTFTAGELTVGTQSATVTLTNLIQTFTPNILKVDAVTVPAGLNVVITYDGLTNRPTNTGSFTVIGTINDSNYSGSVTNIFVVNKASQVITIAPMANSFPLKDLTNVVVSASSDSALPVTLSLDANSVAVLSGATSNGAGLLNNIQQTGNVYLRASQTGNGNYEAAPDATLTINVEKSNQSITFNTLPAQVFNNAPFSLSASASSTLAVSYTVASGPATVVGNTVNITGVGKVVITASQAGDGSYNPAADVNQEFNISQANQILSFDLSSLTGATYGDSPINLSTYATTTSGLPITFQVVSGPGTISGSSLTITGAGDVVIRASQAGNVNYTSATSVNQTLVVAKKPITVTAVSANRFANNANPAFTVTYATFVGSDTAAVMDTPPSVTTTATLASPTGSYDLVPSGAVDDSYSFNYVNGTMTVGSASQAITFGTLADKVYGAGTVTLSATANSGLSVSYRVVSGPATLINSTTLALSGLGAVTIEASQAGNDQYSAATPVEQSFSVTPVAPSITSGALAGLSQPTVSGSADPEVVVNVYRGGVLEGTATADSSGNWSFTFPTDLADGTYAITAKSIDNGNLSTVSNTLNLIVDTQPPVAPVITQLPTPTQQTLPTISGTAPAGLQVILYEGATQIATTTADGTGAWSVPYVSALSEGAYTWTAIAISLSGNSSTLSVGMSVQIDISSPQTPVITTASGTLRNRTPSLTGSAEPGSTVTIFRDGVAVGSVTADGSGNWTYTSTSLGLNTYAFTVKSTDPAGNDSGTSSDTNLTVEKVIGTVVLGSLNQTYDGSARIATATTTPSGLVVDLTYDGSSTAPTSAGIYAVVGTINDANYEGSTTDTLTVNSGTPILDWSPNPSASLVYGTPLSGTQLNATSSVSGTFTYNPSSGAVLNVGTHLLQATFTATNTNFVSGQVLTNQVTVSKATPAIAWNSLADLTYGTALGAAQLNASSPVDGTLSYNPSAGTVLSVGTNPITVTFTPDDTANYESVSLTRNQVVVKKAQVITFDALSDKTYGDASFGLVATADSGATPTLTVVSGPASLSGTQLTLTGAGVVTVRASLAGTGNLEAATSVDQSFTVNRKGLTVTAQDANRAYGAVNPAFAADLTGFVNGENSSVISGTAGFSTTATSSSSPGKYPITPVLGSLSAANYSFDTFTPGELTVAKQSATVTLANLAQTYSGSGLQAGVVTVPAGLTVDFTYNGSATLPIGAGLYTVVATINDSNYSGTATGSLEIAKASQVITLSPLAARTPIKGLSSVPVLASSTSGLPVVLSLGAGSVATLSGTVSNGSGFLDNVGQIGQVYLLANQAGDANYLPASQVSLTIDVEKNNQNLTFGALANKTFGDPAFQLSGTADSGLAVSYRVVSGPATVLGDIVTLTGAGRVVLEASQPGDPSNNPAASVNQEFQVAQGTQAITFGSLAGRTFGDAPFDLSSLATIPSGLPVTFQVVSGPGTISGTTLTMTGAGDIVIRASQPGNSNYSAATNVDETLTVAKKSLTPVFAGSTSVLADGTAKSLTASTTPTTSVALTYNGSPSAPSAIGSYTVTATINDPDYSGTATTTLQILDSVQQALDKIQNYASTDGASTVPSAADYTTAGANLGAITGNANGLVLLNEIVANKNASEVDSVAELDALATLVNQLLTTAAGGTANPALAASDFSGIGISGVTADNLAVVLAAIAASADDGSGIDTLAKFQSLVNVAVGGFSNALSKIQNYDGSNSVPNLADFGATGVTGVDNSNLGSINSALAILPVSATDSRAEVQAIVDAYGKILAAADGTGGNGVLPSAADYAAIGLTGVDAGAETSLLGSVIDRNASSAVDTVAEMQALANAVQAVMDGANGTAGVPTKAQLELLGMTGVTDANLALIQEAIKNAGASGADSLAKLQGLTDGVNTATTSALANIRDAAQNNSATGSNPSLSDYTTALVSGVNVGNLAAINDVLNSSAVNGNAADTTAEIQAIVDAYTKILAAADGVAGNGVLPSSADYAAIGLTGVDAGAETSLLGSVIDRNASSAVDTVAEMQALANAVQAVMDGANGTAGLPTKAQLELLGMTGVTDANLAAIQIAIADTVNDGSAVDSLAKLQAVVSSGASQGLDRITAYATSGGTTVAPTEYDYQLAGVSGVTASNLAGLNAVIRTKTASQVDTASEIQTFVLVAMPDLIAFPSNGAAATQISIAKSALTGNDTLGGGTPSFGSTVVPSNGYLAAVRGNNVMVTRSSGLTSGPIFSYTITVGGQSSTAVVSFSPATNPVVGISSGDVAILSMQQDANLPGMFKIIFAGVPGANYQVQKTSDLVNWSNATSAIANSNGYFQFIDPAATNNRSFYRSYRIPNP